MRTADRYILREILPPFLLGVGTFLVLLIGDVLYVLAEYVATRQVTFSVLFRLLVYKLPAILVITFPVATLFGTLLGLGRLARDRELQAMRLAGVSLGRIFAPVLLFGALTGAAAFVTSESLAPWANQQANALLRRAAFGQGLPVVRQQIFFRAPGDRFFYVEEVHPQQGLRNVMIYELTGPVPRLITARRGTWVGTTLRLTDGVAREFDPQGFTRYEARFAQLDIEMGIPSTTFLAGHKTPDEMTARELRGYLAVFGQDAAARRFLVELHRKFAVPAAALIFALLAAPLSPYASVGGRFLGVGLSTLLLFLYYATMSAGRAMGTTGSLSPVLAAWLPNLLFGSGGAVLWIRQDGGALRRGVPVANDEPPA